MFKVALVLLLAHSVQGIVLSEFFDDVAFAVENDYIANVDPGTWPAVCGNDTTQDGCTFNANYWATHNSVPNSFSFIEAAAWPESPGSIIADSTPYCFDRFRYLARRSNTTVWTGLAPWSSVESLATESTPFPGGGTYFIIVRKVYLNEWTSPCTRLASEYIAALLNRCNQACAPAGHDLLMRRAADFVFSPGCGGDGNFTNFVTGTPSPHPVNPVPTWDVIYTHLRDYNNGYIEYNGTECSPKVGPGYCYTGPGVKPENVTCILETPDCGNTFGCDVGCTRSKGFWKNRRAVDQLGNPIDKKKAVGWDSVCPQAFVESIKGNSTDPLELFPFFPTITWGGILETKNMGDACIIAAKELVAVRLNHECQMACMPDEIIAALASAQAIIDVHCTTLPGLLRKNQTSVRQELIVQANFLQDYNKGVHGPGDCRDVIFATASGSGSDDDEETTTTSWIIAFVVVSVLLFLCCVIVAAVMYMQRSEKYGKQY